MLEASSSPGSTRLIATRAYQSSDVKYRREIQTRNTDLKPAQRTRKALTTPASLSRRNRKRGSQGVDALYYTERTGTASNKPCRWWDRCRPSGPSFAAFRVHPNRLRPLVPEPIAHLHIDLARQVPVESAIGQAVVVLDAVVGYV